MKGLRWLALLPLAWLVAVGVWIGNGPPRAQGKAAVAIVLGSAIENDKPTPVFAARIAHRVSLWRDGRVDRILFTGGRAHGIVPAESRVARSAALRAGVPESAILLEDRSRTTYENMIEARRVMTQEGLRTAFIVSDPLHLQRAMLMANSAGINAQAEPTPYTRYNGIASKLLFLLREIVVIHPFLLLGM